MGNVCSCLCGDDKQESKPKTAQGSSQGSPTRLRPTAQACKTPHPAKLSKKELSKVLEFESSSDDNEILSPERPPTREDNIKKIIHNVRKESKNDKKKEVANVDFTSPNSKDPNSHEREDKPDIKDDGHHALTINDFDFLHILGRGQFGKVYLVKKKSSGVFYAIKVIKKNGICDNKKQEERIITEKNVILQNSHPFIVDLHFSF